jgi:hypothetical protein
MSRTLCLLFALLFAGCSSFEREWKRAATAPRGDVFAGRWEGQWKSEKHRGAGGRLRCILTKADERQYRAQFHAHWLMFASGYTALLDGERRGSELRLSGTHRLTGIGGGLYRYQGRVTPRAFTATYRSSYDDGRFQMSRPDGG